VTTDLISYLINYAHRN